MTWIRNQMFFSWWLILGEILDKYPFVYIATWRVNTEQYEWTKKSIPYIPIPQSLFSGKNIINILGGKNNFDFFSWTSTLRWPFIFQNLYLEDSLLLYVYFPLCILTKFVNFKSELYGIFFTIIVFILVCAYTKITR